MMTQYRCDFSIDGRRVTQIVAANNEMEAKRIIERSEERRGSVSGLSDPVVESAEVEVIHYPGFSDRRCCVFIPISFPKYKS